MSNCKSPSRDQPQPLAPSLRRHTGNRYEQLAARYLCTQGLELISSNYACRLGEIDLIMKHGETLVFVEVRYRVSSKFISPVVSVNASKQRKLWRTAQVYLKHHGLTDAVPCRIDVIGITAQTHGRFRFDWIRNAVHPGI